MGRVGEDQGSQVDEFHSFALKVRPFVRSLKLEAKKLKKCGEDEEYISVLVAMKNLAMVLAALARKEEIRVHSLSNKGEETNSLPAQETEFIQTVSISEIESFASSSQSKDESVSWNSESPITMENSKSGSKELLESNSLSYSSGSEDGEIGDGLFIMDIEDSSGGSSKSSKEGSLLTHTQKDLALQ